jgi:hypothetical protein
MLCTVSVRKIASSAPTMPLPGTKPRRPTITKTIPKTTANFFAIVFIIIN